MNIHTGILILIVNSKKSNKKKTKKKKCEKESNDVFPSHVSSSIYEPIIDRIQNDEELSKLLVVPYEKSQNKNGMDIKDLPFLGISSKCGKVNKNTKKLSKDVLLKIESHAKSYVFEFISSIVPIPSANRPDIVNAGENNYIKKCADDELFRFRIMNGSWKKCKWLHRHQITYRRRMYCNTKTQNGIKIGDKCLKSCMQQCSLQIDTVKPIQQEHDENNVMTESNTNK